MSRIGKKPVPVPAGVKITTKGRNVVAEGPKGKLSFELTDGIAIEVADGKEIIVSRTREERWQRAMHGTTRAMLANMVMGVSTGFTKILQLWGVGYNAEASAKTVVLNVGYCHKVELPIPDGVEVKAERISIEGTNVWQITVSGINKQMVGQLAAEIRRTRPPEPYKGKGIRYEGERIIRKAGKSFTSAS